MGTKHITGCVLCAQNCGLTVEVENNRIVKVTPDKSNVRSEGYFCRKGMNIAYHQHNADRLKYPLKKVGDKFERISWDQAIDEIAEKLKGIIGQYGPRSFAYMGGGGQGCHFEAAFGVRLLRGLGSQYHYSALAQEFAGAFWVCVEELTGVNICTINQMWIRPTFFWCLVGMACRATRFHRRRVNFSGSPKIPTNSLSLLIHVFPRQPRLQICICPSDPERMLCFLKR